MSRVVAAGVMVAVLWTMPAAAQTAPAGQVPPGPVVVSGYVGLNTGVAVVEKFGGVVGLEGGMRIWKNLDVVGEIVKAQNSVARRQLDRIDLLARGISPSVGGPGSANLEAPALFGGFGGRWVLENSGMFRPYVLVVVGGARVTLKPTIMVLGTNITANPAQYGVTLGQDVIGRYKYLATEGGVGVVAGFGMFYVDAGARLLSINADQRINVARLVFGGGYRF
jgi:hypothetical protein